MRIADYVIEAEKRAARALGVDSWKREPAYEYVFQVTASRIHSYLGLQREELLNWVIVGGYAGHEIPQLLRNYPALHIDVFECSQRYAKRLKNRFKSAPRVTVIEKAASNADGSALFKETSLEGSGSLLDIGELGKDLFNLRGAETFRVETVRLDTFYGQLSPTVDVLQIDVQGAEALVLAGAAGILNKVQAIFLEVSQREGLYADAPSFSALQNTLDDAGFDLVLLGMDFNQTGNALFLRRHGTKST